MAMSGNKIPDTHMHAGSMQCRQDDEVHVEQLHEDDPRSDITKLMRMFLDRAQK